MGTNSTQVANKRLRTTTLMGLLCGLFFLLGLMASPAYADEGSAAGGVNAQGMVASEAALATGVSESAAKSAQPADVKAKSPEGSARADNSGADASPKDGSAAGAQEGDGAVGAQESEGAEGMQQGGSVGNAQQGDNADGAQKTDSADGAQQSDNAAGAQKNGAAVVADVQQKDTAVDAASANETELDGSASIVLSEEELQQINEMLAIEGQAGAASVPVHWIAYFNDAYGNLQMVNEDRRMTGTDPNPGSPYYGSPLGSLSWDSSLESYAIQRAVELAVNFAHARPNGGGISDAPTSAYAEVGENIAYGQRDVAAANYAWFEKERDGNGEKGHYHSICRASFKSMACACIESGGVKYYVQIFSGSAGDGKRTMYGDGVGGDSYVDVANSSDIRLALSKTDTLTIKVGDTYQLNPDDKSGYYVVGKNMRTGRNYDVAAWYLNWSVSSGASYASVERSNNNPYYVRITGKAVGTATIKVTNPSNASNYMTFNVNVIPRTVPIANATITFADRTYTGSAQTPSPTTIKYDGSTISSSNYTLSYSNNVNAGTATVTITAKGDRFTGSTTRTFKINPANISNVTFAFPAQTYTGSALTPTPSSATFNGRAVASSQYTLGSYSNNVNAGTASVAVTGKGNFAGTASKNFTIDPAPISNATFAFYSATYTGSSITPTLYSATYNARALGSSDYSILGYYNNVNASTSSPYAYVQGKGNFTGTAYKYFTIDPRHISYATVSCPSQTYTGSALTPTPTVTYNNTTLSTSNYTVGSYSNNVNAGTNTARFTLTGKGNFTGTTTGYFTINPAPISDATFGFNSATYTGSAITPTLAYAYYRSNYLTTSDYSIKGYYNNVNAGTNTAYAYVQGKGNFTGDAYKYFSIDPRHISYVDFVIPDQGYTGSALMPKPTSAKYNNVNVPTSNYKIGTYYNNTNPGSARVDITATDNGNFYGTTTEYFTINPANIANATFTMPSRTYTGSAQTGVTPTTATWNGRSLVLGTDYQMGTYSNNVNAGTASVVIQGIGSFTGSKTAPFTISPANIASVTFAFPAQTYTGAALAPAPSSATFNGRAVAASNYAVGSYTNNVNAGIAKATVTGRGNFTGTNTLNFAIAKAKIVESMIAAIPNQTYDGTAKAPLPTVTFNGGTLVYNKDYTVSYENNTNPGTAKAIVTGKGNFENSANKTFVITAKPQPRPEITWKRLWGQDAIGTMQSIVSEAFANNSCSVAVVATTEGYWDALSASGLAGLYQCPVLLTDRYTLSKGTADELNRLGVKSVYIVGGDKAIDPRVESQLRNSLKLNTARLWGQNAVGTANSIANEILKTKKTVDTCVIATCDGYYDALSIAPYAYNKAIPVFLTAFEVNGVKNVLRADTLSIIANAGCTNAVIVGGANAVSGGTETLLVSKTKIKSIKDVTRLGGKNAWETSNRIAEWSLAHGMKADNVGIADGNGYWDALTGAALCGKRGSVLLLVPHNGLIFDNSMYFSFDPFCIDNFLVKHKNEITRGYFFGGTVVVPTSTENYVKNATKR